jgi:D-arabinose 1-dehydrogenase-like Zn-dependent alcohol dehydrogenase
MVGIPDELSSVEAAPLLCAGATVLGALRHSGAGGGQLVAVQGLGGLGHLAVQFAVKLGCKAVALSRGRDKEALAHKLGAHAYIDTAAGDAAKQLQAMGGASAIICTAPSGKAQSELVGGLAPAGKMVIVAFGSDPMVFSSFLLLAKKSIGGWVGGNLEEAIRFSVHSGVRPFIETFPLEEAPAAYERMMAAKVHFRAVLKMAT